MKLNQLMLCLDCDEVSLIAKLCPICASKSVVELSTWIAPLSVLDTPDERKTRREALFAECRVMVKKMTDMIADAKTCPADQAEHLGCAA
jgi:RNA polymerase subunit RPABC4/transcription elongation factor Spt4